MCNLYRRAVALGEVTPVFAQLKIPLRFPEGAPNLEPTDIRITDTGTIVRASSDEPGAADLLQRRWSWPSAYGTPLFNRRSDGRAFPHSRCLVIASGFYEYTTPTGDDGAPVKGRRKDRWMFTRPGEEWFAIAGIWQRHRDVGEAYVLLTTVPGEDVAPYHNRQVVILEREHWARWLGPEEDVSDLLAPGPPGTLAVAAAPAA